MKSNAKKVYNQNEINGSKTINLFYRVSNNQSDKLSATVTFGNTLNLFWRCNNVDMIF